jgi:mono/diheme cytochrome c family protein
MRALAVLAVAAFLPGAALADSATGLGSKGVSGASGAAIYQHVCQGCHQEGGKGAKGAGAFPALAGDPNLEQVGYPLTRVLEGHGGMPWFNGVLTDAQIADVINYVRSHFGNHYTDVLTAADVTAAKGPAPVMER